MTTSGTWAFNLDISEIIEEAYERIGVEARNGYQLRTARRSLNMLLLEWQNKGLHLWTVKSASEALIAGQIAYPLTAEKLDIIDAVLRTDAGNTSKQADLFMKRISVSTYAKQTNKLTQGRPIQYWLERAPEGITVNVWPVPDGTQTYTFHYYYMERIEDTGRSAANTIDVPARFLPALTAGLALSLALKDPEKIMMADKLEQVYEKSFTLAAESAREKASWCLKPYIARV